IDFKGFLLNKGERAGVVAAAVIAVLLIGTALLVPGKGLFSGNPRKNAEQLDQATAVVRTRLNDPNNTLPETELPPKERPKVVFAFDSKDPDKYWLAQIIPPESGSLTGRLQPKVLTLDEGSALAARVQLQSYLFIRGTRAGDPPSIALLKDP